MTISHLEAIDILLHHASQQGAQFGQEGEEVPLSKCTGRICAEDYDSPFSTPPFDTSAMDGYAVCSKATQSASIDSPVTLCVRGTMAAGQEPLLLDGKWEDGALTCSEIMTGAQFPESTSEMEFDACIKIEDTMPLPSRGSKSKKYVQISKPARLNQNRRPAGLDVRLGERLISAGTTIRPQHVMALASVGIKTIHVNRRLRIGILSTGSELMGHNQEESQRNCIYNSNGPYISAVLNELGVDVLDLGIIPDDSAGFEAYLTQTLAQTSLDMLISTGAVSKGKFDFVPGGLAAIGATIRFHHVKVRPGHPILFASLPCHDRDGEMAYFGLPGNPTAAAVGLRFFVMPYLLALHGQPRETAVMARVCKGVNEEDHRKSTCIAKLNGTSMPQVFSHGRRQFDESGVSVRVSNDQGSSKVRPLLTADCWISIQGGPVVDGQAVETFPLHLGSLGSSSDDRRI